MTDAAEVDLPIRADRTSRADQETANPNQETELSAALAGIANMAPELERLRSHGSYEQLRDTLRRVLAEVEHARAACNPAESRWWLGVVPTEAEVDLSIRLMIIRDWAGVADNQQMEGNYPQVLDALNNLEAVIGEAKSDLDRIGNPAE